MAQLSTGCHTHITVGHFAPRQVPTPAHLPLRYIQLYPAGTRGQWESLGPDQAEGRGRGAVGDSAPIPTCQAGRTFSMSFRLIPSPSSSFPFPHLDQKKHNNTERTAHSCILSRPSKQEEQGWSGDTRSYSPSRPKNQPVPPGGNGPGEMLSSLRPATQALP